MDILIDKVELINDQKLLEIQEEIIEVLAKNQISFRVATYCLNHIIQQIEIKKDSLLISTL